MEVGRQISVREGLGVQSVVVSLNHFLILYGESISEPWKIVTSTTEWLENPRPPWTVHRALMPGGLI